MSMAEIADWFNDVSAEVQNSFKNIDDTKAELKEEIRRIGEIKIQAKETKSYVEIDSVAQLKETIMESVAHRRSHRQMQGLSHQTH